MEEYAVFPGVRLICWGGSPPKEWDGPLCPAGCLVIDGCREGRCEYRRRERLDALSPGDLAVRRSTGESGDAFYPTGEYRGVTVIVDPALAPECFDSVLEGVNVRPAALLARLCPDGAGCVLRSVARLEHILSGICTAPESLRRGVQKVKVLELLLFLSGLDTADVRAGGKRCSRTQAELAERVCAYLAGHMDRRCTIEELSALFHVSATQLKRCFREVCGAPVYTYIRREKMRAAAAQLLSTDRTVMDIAGAFGYDNASKFARAFRDELGMTPREYRQSGGRPRGDASEWSGKPARETP